MISRNERQARTRAFQRIAGGRAIRILVAAILTGNASCRDEVSILAPIARFSPHIPGQADRTTTINDDTRDSLGAPIAVPLLFGPQTVRPDSRFHFRSSLHDRLKGSRRLLLLSSASVAEEWTTLASSVVDVDGQGENATVTYEVSLPGAAVPGTATVVSVEAIDVSGGTLHEHRTPALLIPADSKLAFASGVIGNPTVGRATFTIEACRGDECRAVYRHEADVGVPEQRGWSDATIDLAGFTGTEVSFVFRSESIDAAGRPAGFPVWGNPRVISMRWVARRPPNILLVSIDTLAAGHLPVYGYEFDTAPFLSEMAASGVLFERCVAAATHTLESHMTMMTGLPAVDHGVHHHPAFLDPKIPTLAEHLRSHGFATAAFTEDGWVSNAFGFARGFDVYRENRSAELTAPDGFIATTFDQGLRWLEANDDGPFFLFLHSYQVHDPFTPPAEYSKLFRPEGSSGLLGYEAEKLHYDQEIRYADDQLRSLWKRVEDLGHGDDTILIVTSDHGEAFLEHGWLRHGSYLYDEVVHVPLLARGPGVAVGQRIEGTVGHADLFPTIAELAGTPAPTNQRGMSLAPVLHNPRWRGRLFERVVVAETWSPVAYASGMTRYPFPGPAFAAVQGRRKLSRYPRDDGSVRYEYFNLGSDPGETENLWETRSGEVNDLKVLLDQWQERGQRARRDREQASRRPDLVAPQGDLHSDPSLQEKLRALGYLN